MGLLGRGLRRSPKRICEPSLWSLSPLSLEGDPQGISTRAAKQNKEERTWPEVENDRLEESTGKALKRSSEVRPSGTGIGWSQILAEDDLRGLSRNIVVFI